MQNALHFEKVGFCRRMNRAAADDRIDIDENKTSSVK
jgi:hypothetical protein